MIHDIVWQVDAKCVFDEVENGLATTGITSYADVGLDIRNDVAVAVGSLNVHGFEE